MTDQELREKKPNLMKLMDIINEQDKQGQAAAYLLLAMAALLKGEAV